MRWRKPKGPVYSPANESFHQVVMRLRASRLDGYVTVRPTHVAGWLCLMRVVKVTTSDTEAVVPLVWFEGQPSLDEQTAQMEQWCQRNNWGLDLLVDQQGENSRAFLP